MVPDDGFNWTVESGEGLRLDRWLSDRLPEISRSRIQSLIREQLILRNGAATKPRDVVQQGDTIHALIPENVPTAACPQDLPLTVLFEDDDLIVIDKAMGMVVHPAVGNHDGTVVNALLHHCAGRLAFGAGELRPGIVHRLDKETSGCLVAAKTDDCHAALVSQFAGRTTEKIYLAVTQSRPRPDVDTVFTHIGRHPVHRQKMAVVDPPNGRASITDYQVVAEDVANGSCLVMCHLHTGRTHQIRVHMRHKGCALIGDSIYAQTKRQAIQTGRLMLHAWQLSIDHPTTSQRLTFRAKIPTEFEPWLGLLPSLNHLETFLHV